MTGPRLAVLLCLLATACAPRTAAVATSSVAAADSLVLERAPCFGDCPSYRLVLDASGRVAYASRNPGDSTSGTDRVAPSTLATLVARAEALDFFGLPGRVRDEPALCPRFATDHPTATLVIYRAAGAKSVEDYHGCRLEGAAAPAAVARLRQLRALEAAVDSLTGSARWVRPAERR
jgi:hypothetical protein